MVYLSCLALGQERKQTVEYLVAVLAVESYGKLCGLP